MLFSSIEFLYYFLPIVLILYFAVPLKFKNLVLLLTSLFFYFYGEPVYTLLMLGTTLSSYIHAFLIDRFRGKTLSKVFLASSVVTSILVLGFFKYSDFFVSNINSLLKTDMALLGLALPIGISFYTFQTLSYTIDVYRGQAKLQKSFIRLATYVALFPQLIAGPIVRYTTVEEELSHRTHSFENFSYGANRFIIGLSKKVLVADTMSALATAMSGMNELTVGGMWIYSLANYLFIYFDFSAYSDMAIGLGRIFGFHFLENFNYPFISKSVSEFWRRWHMSLGTWFRDYIYIPLGGNRVALPKWMFNTFVVWFVTGFWHGADWTFIIWGLYFFVFLVMEKFFLQKWLNKLPKFASHIYVTFVIAISFVIFSGAGFKGMVSDLSAMFGGANLAFWSKETTYHLTGYAIALAAAVFGATPALKNLFAKLHNNKKSCRVLNVLEPVFHVVLLLIVTAYFVDGSFSPFLYFRF